MKLRRLALPSVFLFLSACGNNGSSTPDASTPPIDMATAVDSSTTGDASGTSCSPGQTTCSGACTDVKRDNENCGACGTACASGKVCNGMGVCEVTCTTGLVVCGGKCVDPLSDNKYCGATTCADDATDGTQCGAGSVCDGTGTCKLSCTAGQVACGGKCIDPLTDRAYCGATTCADDATNGEVCATGFICNGAGQCTLSCKTGQVACGGKCVDPNTDNNYCGATTCADVAASGAACDPGFHCNGAGACTPSCVVGQLFCGNKCVDPKTDNNYCGATDCSTVATDGDVCDPGYSCNGSGACTPNCPVDQVFCGGKCIDPKTDRAYCGATTCADAATSGAACDSGFVCDGAGSCTLSCQAGFGVCGGTCQPTGPKTFVFTGTVQTFTVPCTTGPIHVVAEGAQGGTNGGLGASMSGDFPALTTGTTLTIVVGEQGHAQIGGNSQNSSGGGGGTFVYAGPTPYIVAGGGGGKCNYVPSGNVHALAAGQITQDGAASSNGNAGGTGGNPGPNSNQFGRDNSGGGAGWLMSAAPALGGSNFASNWAGGAGFCDGGGGGCGGVGGYGGGGGGGNDYGGGGGGGGYSGGAGGGDPDHGGGGGSFNTGDNQVNVAGARSGNGRVVISW